MAYRRVYLQPSYSYLTDEKGKPVVRRGRKTTGLFLPERWPGYRRVRGGEETVRRILLVSTVAVVMAAMMIAMTLPAFAAPKAGAGCKGLLNAIAKQNENRPEGANPKLVQKATERGCITETPPAEE